MPKAAKVATLPEPRLSTKVSEFITARPVIAAEFPRIHEMIVNAFDHPEVVFQITHHDIEEDPEPTLSITVSFRESREDARGKCRALLGGPWLDLSAFTLARVALHLGQPLE